MTDIKTFKDIDKGIQKLVDDTKKNFKLTKSWQDKLEIHAVEVLEKTEKERKPRAKVQKEMLRVLETQEAHAKVRTRDKIAADYKMGKATLDQLKAARLTKEDLINSGFGVIGSNIELMTQGWQETVGKFTGAVKGYWSYLKENSTVLKAAQKFWQSTAVQKFKDIGNQIAGSIGVHLREVLGEFQEVFDTVKNVLGAITSSISGMFSGLFNAMREKNKEKREKRMVDHLKKIQDGIGFMVRGEKRDAISGDTKKSKGLSLLEAALFGLGASIGAVTGTILLPFRLLTKAVKTGIMPLVKILGKTAVFTKLGTWFQGLKLFMLKIPGMGALGKGLTFLTKMVDVFKKIPGFSHLLGGIKFGFNKLMWPLQIIMSTIDFVKGYMKTEGSILDKIKGGLKEVMKKFFEWPMKILNSAWESTKNFFTGKKEKKNGMPVPINNMKNSSRPESLYGAEIAAYKNANVKIQQAGNTKTAESEKLKIKNDDKNTDKLVKAIEDSRTLYNAPQTNISGGGQESGGIKSFPDADSQLNNNNFNWMSPGQNFSDRRLKQNIRGL